jgi:phosphate transport system permease protein
MDRSPRRAGPLRSAFATAFLTSGDSRDPELAGIWGAVVGSFLTLVVTLTLVFPLGVSAASISRSSRRATASPT